MICLVCAPWHLTRLGTTILWFYLLDKRDNWSHSLTTLTKQWNVATFEHHQTMEILKLSVSFFFWSAISLWKCLCLFRASFYLLFNLLQDENECVKTNSNSLSLYQVVTAQWLAWRLATAEDPSSNPGKGENLLISD